MPAEHLACDALGQALHGDEHKKCSLIGLQAGEAVLHGLDGLAALGGCDRVGAVIRGRDFGCGGPAGLAGVGEQVLGGLADERNETALGLRLAVHQTEEGLLCDLVGEFRIAALRLTELEQRQA